MKLYNKKNISDIQIENYKESRNNLKHILSSNNKKVVVFSSSSLRDIKNTDLKDYVVNLAKEFVAVNKTVIVLDFNMRKSETLQESKLCSLQEYFLDSEDKKLPVDVVDKVHYVRAGYSNNPVSFLEMDKVQDLVQTVRGNYDYVFIISSNVCEYVDTCILGKLSDGVVLIEKQGLSKYANIDKSIEKMSVLDIEILGIIFIEVPLKLFGNYIYS